MLLQDNKSLNFDDLFDLNILMTSTHWDFARFAWEPLTLTLHMNVY